jgi:NodT family efflux transporter outer membrane factor (OMF) lipoprotein
VTTFSVPVDASWSPDLWGRVRNAVRASRYAAQVSAADLVNVRLMQESSLATFYFELRGQDALVELYERTIRADTESLELTRARFETGVGPEDAVAQATVTLANAQAAAVGLMTNRAIYEHAIATLIGTPAGAFALPRKALVTSPPAIPVGIPSDLLQRRPDIAAAERTLAEANAQIGVAEAAYYPSLTLSASGGLAAATLGALFAAPTLVWSVGASASETIFEGGLRRATVALDKALYQADVAAYRQTVLTAFQEVEDQLASLRVLSQQVVEQERAVVAARRFLELALSKYETGIGQYLDVITAQTLLLGAEQAFVTLHVGSMTAAVSLVQALGGGWDVSKLPPAE